MIVVIAPYSPAGRSPTPHLGAARKIEAVIDILSQLETTITLVNTAHEQEIVSPLSKSTTTIAGKQLIEITPPTYSNRKRGKFLNLFNTPEISDAVLEMGEPILVWLYNGYAMESRLGLELKRRTGCHIIQEMEDWHFSRKRGLNPKPFIDWWFWREAARRATHIFSVNDTVANYSRQMNPHLSLFPGVVADSISSLKIARPPFLSTDGTVTLGYFGGLSEEKGAHHIISLLKTLPIWYKFIVTGAGPLESEFSLAAKQSDGRLMFHGRVTDETLTALIGQCDVLLNPHSPITRMGNGVFPFKVIEAIASGRMLISTSLPREGLEDVLQGVCFVEQNIAQFQEALLDAKNWFATHQSKIKAGADATAARFSKTVILNTVKMALMEKSK